MSVSLAPLVLVTHEASFSLLLTDFRLGAPIFAEFGYEAGGYAWQGVAETLVRLHAGHLDSRLSFDSESSMFTAYGPDRDALLDLAGLIKQAMGDAVVLRTALLQTDPRLMD